MSAPGISRNKQVLHNAVEMIIFPAGKNAGGQLIRLNEHKRDKLVNCFYTYYQNGANSRDVYDAAKIINRFNDNVCKDDVLLVITSLSSMLIPEDVKNRRDCFIIQIICVAIILTIAGVVGAFGWYLIFLAAPFIIIAFYSYRFEKESIEDQQRLLVLSWIPEATYHHRRENCYNGKELPEKARKELDKKYESLFFQLQYGSIDEAKKIAPQIRRIYESVESSVR